MSWTLHTSAGAIATAGANVNSDIVASGSTLATWSDEAESLVCNSCRVNLISNYASLNSSGKNILSSICDAYVAQKIISYEPEAVGLSGSSLRLNVLQNQISQGLNQIKEDKVKTYLSAT